MRRPDCFDSAISQLVLDDDELDHVQDLLKRWFKHGETLTLEVDTVNETINVVVEK